MVSTNASTENTQPDFSVSVPNSPTILTINSNEQLININVVAQAPLKLDNTNYQSWRYQWETILTAYDFLHFIEQPPSSTATLFHQRQDHLIRSAIVASLSSDIVPFVIDAKSSYALWQNLTATYAKPSRAHIMSLRESLSNLKKALPSCSSWTSKFNMTLSPQPLRVLETPVTFEELHEKLLDFEQNLIRSSSSTTVPITTNFAAKPLLHNNRSRPNHASRPGNNLNPTDRPASNNFGAQLAGQNTNRNRPRVTCQLCDKPGHHVKQCRKLLAILSLINGFGFDGQQEIMLRLNHNSHANRPESNTVDIWVPSHHIIPFTSSPSSNSSHAISSTSNSGSISHEVATSNRSSSDEPENSITSFPGMSSSTSSSTSASSSSLSVPTHSTSSVPSSAPIPNHSMVTRSKNNISKPIQRLCLNATLSSKAESSPAAQPSKLQATSSNSH
ncbi:hypothetical protein H5410_041210 [Solanum commersonii]|uniref:Retrotransposon Copia-like N-terminal domain-containing protein n=1 Tax=Solanum commersonii TaxID=4109 RepID=A0A9J5XU52_SOLCO|nr:hypothetical protein H5410_041210 [Solanum commersonii]